MAPDLFEGAPFNFWPKYYTMKKVAEHDKHSSLLHFSKNYIFKHVI